MRKSIENLGGRKLTGGRIIPNRTRRKYEIDRYPNEPIVGETKNVMRRVRGNNVKVAFKFAEFANVNDQDTKKTTKVKIIRVIQKSCKQRLREERCSYQRLNLRD